MSLNSVIALLEARIQHLQAEADRNKRSNYADISRWRRMECEYILQQVRKMMEAKT